MTSAPLYSALISERFSSTWWVTTRPALVDKTHERAFEKALDEALSKLDRHETPYYEERVAS